MPGNSFGTLFTVATFGESHGPAMGCIVDGCPPGLALVEADIQQELDRRRPGSSKYTTQRREPDRVSILSGVFEGVTTGTPIGLVIHNEDQRSRDYSKIRDTFRPGHADYVYERKYLKERLGVRIRGYLAAMGDITIDRLDWDEIDNNPFFCPDAAKVPLMEQRIEKLRRDGDSVGARIEVLARGVPAGWGEPVFDRLDAEIGRAMLAINAVKGVEIGDGFASVAQHGSEHRDEMTPDGFLTNHAGGVLGGISTGQDIRVSIALKPTSSIRIPGRSIDREGNPAEVVTTGRHDPCVGVRATPIAEAMLALVLMDHYLRHRAQNADVEPEVPEIPSGGE